MSKKTIIKFLILTIAFTFALSINYIFAAWVGPTAAPPGGNTPTPVHIGTTDQVKDGGLSLNALSVFGSAYVQGNVGIGTTDPQAKLQVGNGVLIHDTDNAANGPDIEFGSTASIAAGKSLHIIIDPVNSANTRAFTIGTGSYTTNPSDGYTELMRVQDNGRVGIGDTTPDATLDVVGNIIATGTITPSDERLKENITVIDNSLEKLKAIRGAYFNMIGSDKRELGVIAQDVQKSFPEAVSIVEEDGTLGVSYSSLIPVLIEAVKALKAENENLEKRILELEGK